MSSGMKREENEERGTQTSLLESVSPGKEPADYSSESRRDSIIAIDDLQPPRDESRSTNSAKDSDPAIEAWNVASAIRTVFRGYNFRWEVHVLLLQ